MGYVIFITFPPIGLILLKVVVDSGDISLLPPIYIGLLHSMVEQSLPPRNLCTRVYQESAIPSLPPDKSRTPESQYVFQLDTDRDLSPQSQCLLDCHRSKDGRDRLRFLIFTLVLWNPGPFWPLLLKIHCPCPQQFSLHSLQLLDPRQVERSSRPKRPDLFAIEIISGITLLVHFTWTHMSIFSTFCQQQHPDMWTLRVFM